MPSPFPGMDPWLEDPRLWPDVHHELISVIRKELNQGLRPRYHARLEERVYVSDDDDPGRKVIIPDVKIRRSKKRPFRPGSGSALAVAEPIVSITLIDQEIKEPYITLIDTTDRTVVTIIEVLSPTNKFPNARGRVEYQYKRRGVMTSQTHLVEIDLLRGGERMDYGPRVPEADYLIHVSRVEERPNGRVWLCPLEESLPPLPVPLRGNDPDFVLDLQGVLATAYERGGYDLAVNYREPPDPPLGRRAATWARKTIAAASSKRKTGS